MKIFYRPDIENVIKIKEDKWFKDQQFLLLQMVNTDYGKDLLCVPKNYKNIFKFGKNHIFYNPRIEDGVYKYDWDFRVGAKWANVIRKRWEEFQGAALWFQSQNSMRPVVLVGNRQYAFGGPYFPDADPETTSVDGIFFSELATWATDRAAATADSVNDTIAAGIGIRSGELGAADSIRWTYLGFDATAIPDTDTISTATVSLASNGTAKTDNDNNAINLLSCAAASLTGLVTGDYDSRSFATVYGSLDITSFSDVDTTYNDITLSNVALISKTVVTEVCCTTSGDQSNTAPTVGDNYVWSGITLVSA